MVSLSISFGKGILFFAHGLVLAFGRGLKALKSVRDILVTWVLYLAGLILVYGSWWAWYGGFTWGPPFLVFPSLPAALPLAAPLPPPPRSLPAPPAALAAFPLSVWGAIQR